MMPPRGQLLDPILDPFHDGMTGLAYLLSGIRNSIDQPLGNVLVALVVTTIDGHSEILSDVSRCRPRVEQHLLPPILRCSSRIGGWQCAAGPPDVVSLTSAQFSREPVRRPTSSSRSSTANGLARKTALSGMGAVRRLRIQSPALMRMTGKLGFRSW